MMLRLMTPALLGAALVFTACDNKVLSETSPQETPVKPAQAQTPPAPEKTAEAQKTQSRDGVFLPSDQIQPDGRYLLLVFGSDGCKYCKTLKEDIAASPELTKMLTEQFSPYYLRIDASKPHSFLHEEQQMQVDTRMLADIYGVSATPTLIFSDLQGKSIFAVPGYMPKEQFLVTLEFVTGKHWEGIERKGSGMYDALKKFYIQKGIIKTQEKKPAT